MGVWRFRRSTMLILSALVATGLLAGCGARRAARPSARPLAHPGQETPWQFGGVRGRKLSTEHYDVYTTSKSPGLTGGIAGFMEAARAYYVELTGLDPEVEGDGKFAVYLFGSRQEWEALTRRIIGERSQAVLQVQAGGYCYKGVGVFWDIGTMATYSVAAHEGLHQFMYHAARQRLPHWAEEGLATQAEGFRVADGLVWFDPMHNTQRLTTLRESILVGIWRPVPRLVAMTSLENIEESPFRGAEYYGQLWAMMMMIRNDETYNAGLLRLCADAAAGRLRETLGFSRVEWAGLERNPSAYSAVVGPRAFAHYIDADTERFEQRFTEFAHRLAHLD